MKIKQLFSLVVTLLSFSALFAQSTAEELAGKDKYNVVIGVLSLIFICIIVYLIVLDRKVRKLEKQKKQQNG